MSITNRCTKRLTNELKLFLKEPVDNVKVAPDENNLLEWYFVIHNIKDHPYKNGVYLGKIDIPYKYPLAAPSISFLTPNGRFTIGDKICTTFTNYHQEEWSPQWTIQGMILGLISFMLDDTGRGVASIVETPEVRERLANNSKEYNKKNYWNIFNKHFPELL